MDGWIILPFFFCHENGVCLLHLLHIFKCFQKLLLWKQTLWTLIGLLQREQSDLGPYCLQYRLSRYISRWESRWPFFVNGRNWLMQFLLCRPWDQSTEVSLWQQFSWYRLYSMNMWWFWRWNSSTQFSLWCLWVLDVSTLIGPQIGTWYGYLSSSDYIRYSVCTSDTLFSLFRKVASIPGDKNISILH